MTTKPASTLGFAQAPIADKNGLPSWNMLQWFVKIETRANVSLTTLGLNPNAPIGGSTNTLGAVNNKTQNLTPNGLLPTASLTGTVSSTQVGFTLDSVPDGSTRFAVVNKAGLNGVALVDAANLALINFADTAHQNKILDNINDGVTYQRFTRVAAGQMTLPTGLIAPGASNTTTIAIPGVLATDSIEWAFSGSPAVGYNSLSIIPYVTAGNVNFNIGNPSAGGITPGAQSINYVVIR